MKKVYKKHYDIDKAAELVKQLNISNEIASLLIMRGIEDTASAEAFLHPKQSNLSNPLNLAGMNDAVTRIKQAITAHEKVVIYGDYDCDGICATAIIKNYLSEQGVDVYHYIPNRYSGGYGLSIETLEEIAETYYPDLMVTVDCGISAVEEAAHMAEVLAIDLIVTDHHSLPGVLPDAIIVNPKLNIGSDAYDLCGAGIAFKLVEALAGREKAMEYVDLACIATIADIVPLTRENRVITALGLEKLNNSSLRRGLRMLLESLELTKVTASDVAFKIAPRINAVGRLGECTDVVDLFTSNEYLVLECLIERINNDNAARQSISNNTYKEAAAQIKDIDFAIDKVIVLYNPDWQVGILGLVAARLCKDYHRPAILFCGEDVLKGSARSIPGVDIYKCLCNVSELLLGFGGHSGAAGLKMEFKNIIGLRSRLNDYINATYDESAFLPVYSYELAVNADNMNISFAQELQLLEPTGSGNPKPQIVVKSSDVKLTAIGATPHIKGKLNAETDVVAFGYGYLLDGINAGMQYALLADYSLDSFRNRDFVQLRVTDAVPTDYAANADDTYAFSQYMRTALFGNELAPFIKTTFDKASELFYEENFGTLFIAFSADTANKFIENCSKGANGKLSSVDYCAADLAPVNRLIIAPDTDLSSYKRIVILDTPLSKGYVSHIKQRFNGELYMVCDNYPFAKTVSAINLDSRAIADTKSVIDKFLLSGGSAKSPMDLYVKAGAGMNCNEFLAHFLIIYELGGLKVENGFALYPKAMQSAERSVLLARLNALAKTEKANGNI